jgi:1-phosphofructokinase/tagatose 6-phosphate kinase
VCVLAGSLPRGVSSDLYGRIIDEMKRLDVTTVLDAEGEPMRAFNDTGVTAR